MHIDEKQLKEFILDSGLVSRADFEKVEEEAIADKIPISKALIKTGKLNDDDWRRVQAYMMGIPFVDLKGLKIESDVLSLIPEPIARNHNILAFEKNGDSLQVVMLDTDDLPVIDFIKKKLGLKILPRLTDVESMKSALLQYQKSLKAEFGDIIQKEAEAIQTYTPSDDKGAGATESDLKKMAEDLPIVRIVETLLKHAIIQNASDIHIEPLETEVLVRYRIDGILHDAMVLPRNSALGIVARIKVLSNLKLDEKRLPQDGRFKVEANAEKVSFRVSVLPTYFGEKIVMRLLKEGKSGFTLEKLGFHGEGLERIHSGTKQRTGMILCAGPTGSGKTTTLYTVLDILNTASVNISTIEDPIEYQMPRVNQTQVKPEIGFSFANGLRSLLRQDPDIVMVGEIRDNETAGLAINASLTGHLVLSTLHTNSAAGAIPRLLDMKCEPFLLVSTLNVVIGQRLIRKLCDKKDQYFLSKAEFADISKEVDMNHVLDILREEKIVAKTATWDKIPFFRAKPSTDSEDGYKGRVGIHEVLKISASIKDLVMKRASAKDIEDQAKKEGMLTMIEDGIFKAVQGVTTIEEVLRVVSE
ncbi:MAG: GspE/PulE family protein [Candidatus Pacebacteria bacterium]|nr:GspE/PulE family protein [Candidatus Paceibacterota bacterium]MDD5357302.1 GspE/PulE family protein [Candidatus Paceibacterota bacterium]